MLSKGSRSSLAHLSQVPGVKLQVFPEATWVEVASLGWYLLGAVYRLTPHAVLQVESHQEAHSGDLVHTPDQRRPPGVDKDCVAAPRRFEFDVSPENCFCAEMNRGWCQCT